MTRAGVGVLSLLLAAVLALVHAAGERQRDRDAVERLAASVEDAELAIEGWLDEQATLRAARAGAFLSGPTVTTAAIEQALVGSNVGFALVTDAAGRVLAWYPERLDREPGEELAGQFAHVDAALDGRVGHSAGIPATTTDSGVVVGVGVPYASVDGRRVLSTAFELAGTAVLERARAPIALTRGQADVVLLDDAGRLLASSSATLGTSEAMLGVSRLAPAPTTVRSLFGADDAPLRDGTTLYSRRIGTTPWWVAVVVPESARAVVVAAPGPLGAMTTIGLWVLVTTALWSRARAPARGEDGPDAAAPADGPAASSGREDFVTLFTSSPLATLVVGPGGQIMRANPAARRLLVVAGRAERPLVGASVDEVFGTRVTTELRPGERWSGENSAVDTEGRTRHVRVSAASIVSSGQWVVQVVDLTDERAAARELERSNEALRRFGGTIAHDLRSPLASVAGFGELLLDASVDLDEATREDLLRRLVANAHRAADVVDTVLRDGHAGPAQRTPVRLADEVRKVEELVGPMLAEHGAQVRYVGTDVPVRCHVATLNAVLTNTITNAIKYRDAHRPLEIRVEAALDDDVLTVRIVDNGRGVPSTDLERIFDDGYRVGDVDTVGDGTGLAAVRRLVGQQGGIIRAESGDGPGLTIVMRLPASHAAQSTATGAFRTT